MSSSPSEEPPVATLLAVGESAVPTAFDISSQLPTGAFGRGPFNSAIRRIFRRWGIFQRTGRIDWYKTYVFELTTRDVTVFKATPEGNGGRGEVVWSAPRHQVGLSHYAEQRGQIIADFAHPEGHTSVHIPIQFLEQARTFRDALPRIG